MSSRISIFSERPQKTLSALTETLTARRGRWAALSR